MAEQNIENKGGLPASIQRITVIIRKWRWTAFSVALVIVALMTAYTLLRAPVYTAVGRVWIENDPNILPFDDVLRYDAGSYLESHSKLFRSRSLAAETIEKLKLYEDPRFVGEPGKRKKPVDIKDPFFREALVGAFIGRITVTPLLRTRIVEVAFEDRDPKFASDTLNALFDGYLEMTARQKYLSLEDASKFLNSQIEAVRNELTESEKKLNAYGSEQDILPLTAAETPMVTRVADISRELMQASVERVKKNSEYLQIKSGTLESIPSSRDNPLVQSLREQYSMLSQEYAKKLANVRPEYPEMQRMKSQMDSINAALQKERENMIGAAFSDYQAALSKEQSLQRLLDQEKTQAFSAQSSSIIYNSLKAEIENKRVLLNELITRQSETDMSSRLKSMKPTNVWIVDRASLPLQPTSPKKRRDLLLGLVFGVIGGCGAAFLIEYLNHSVKTSRDVTTQTGLPTLGLIPSFDGETRAKSPRAEFARILDMILHRDGPKAYASGKARARALASLRSATGLLPGSEDAPVEAIELIVSRNPGSIQSENFRSIRTTMLISAPPGRIKSVLFTSALAREGKSSTVSNLAVTLAQANKRVIIVDSDLRRPKQHRIFDVENREGLSTFLSSSIGYLSVVKPTRFPNLAIISSGPPVDNPVELLNSDRMDDLIAILKQNYDHVLLDAPPLLAVSDVIALSPVVDGIILIARAGKTPINALKQAKQKLDAHKLKALGVILNSVNIVEQDGYYARQYYKYYR
jgi:succinoglycan biosynthesis transport protein ExoP